jgi:hypothetical protein
VNKEREFIVVCDANSLNKLIDMMSEAAREKAEHKIGLSRLLKSLEKRQYNFPL